MLNVLRYKETSSVFAPVLPFRCGHVCKHADANNPDRCQHPEVRGAAVEIARKRGYACGPEATLMEFKR